MEDFVKNYGGLLDIWFRFMWSGIFLWANRIYQKAQKTKRQPSCGPQILPCLTQVWCCRISQQVSLKLLLTYTYNLSSVQIFGYLLPSTFSSATFPSCIADTCHSLPQCFSWYWNIETDALYIRVNKVDHCDFNRNYINIYDYNWFYKYHRLS
jgi:hypothetical protein